VQLQQPKPFPLRVREFSDYLDVFGAWCVLVRGAEALGSEKGAKRSSVCLFVCLCLYLSRGVLTLCLIFLQVDTWEEIK